MSYTKKNYAIHPRTEVRFSPLSTKQLSDLDFWLIILKEKPLELQLLSRAEKLNNKLLGVKAKQEL